MNLWTHHAPLAPKTPFDFRKSLGFLGSFPPTRGEQRIDAHAFVKAVALDGRPVAYRVASVRGRLSCELFSERPLAPAARDALVARVSFQLGLEDDLEGFYELARDDRPFAPLVDAHRGLRHVKFSVSPFEVAAWAILAQRTPMARARVVKDRIVERFGAAIEVDGATLRAFPDAPTLAARSLDELDALVQNRPKSAAIHAVAAAFADVDPAFLERGPFDEVERWLLDLPKIGAWSSSFVLFRGLGRMERPLRGNVAIAEAARAVYGVTGDAALARSDRYGDLRGYWAYYLRVGGR